MVIICDREKIEKAAAILENVRPSNPFEYGKWRRITKYDLTKIAVVRALSPQTRVSSLRSLEYSADLDELLTDISDDRIESILRRHKIRFPKRKVKAVRLVRSIGWMKTIRDLEKLSGRSVEDEREARIRIMKRTFGMGLKTVSDLLKDIGFSKHLAVLDSRNLRFLKSVGVAPKIMKASRLSDRRIYFELEDIENEIANRLGITVSELDEKIMTYTGASGELPHRV
jgi:thermostable 8-oxoguanine DNA glycosylase